MGVVGREAHEAETHGWDEWGVGAEGFEGRVDILRVVGRIE